MRLGYLEQTAVSGSTLTVEDEARSQMHRANAAVARLAEAEAAVESAAGGPGEALLHELSEVRPEKP